MRNAYLFGHAAKSVGLVHCSRLLPQHWGDFAHDLLHSRLFHLFLQRQYRRQEASASSLLVCVLAVCLKASSSAVLLVLSYGTRGAEKELEKSRTLTYMIGDTY